MIDRSLGLHVEREKKTRRETGVWDERYTGAGVDDNNRNRGINDMFGGSRGLHHQITTSTYLFGLEKQLHRSLYALVINVSVSF